MRIKPIPWPKFRDELLSLYIPPMRAKNTYFGIKSTLGLLEELGAKTTADLTPPLVAALVASRPPDKQRTTHSILRRVRAATRYAEARGYLRSCPFRARPVGSWVRPGPPRVKPHHTREEIRRVLELMRLDIDQRAGWAKWEARRLYAITTLVCLSGIRRNECLFLHVEDLDLDARVVWIQERTGHRLKTEGSAQPVPIPLAAVPVLRDWLIHRLDRPPRFKLPESVPWLWPNHSARNCWTEGSHGSRPHERLRAVGLRAGVPGLGFHSLRRSLATAFEGTGLSQALITRILRHTDERTSTTYYQAADVPNLARAVQDFSYD
jgi:integrase